MITVHDAATLYPELGRLYTVMTQTGAVWQFRSFVTAGEIKGLLGRRVWPDTSADELGIRSQTNGRAVRKNPIGEIVWEKTGTVADVVDLVLEELFPPSHPDAPRRAQPRVIAASGLLLPGPRPARACLVLPRA